MSAAETLPPLFIRSYYTDLATNPEALERLSATWLGWWEPFCSSLPTQPPERSSEAEFELLTTFGKSLAHLVVDTGEHAPQLFAFNPETVFEELVTAEFDQGAPRLRLSVKLLTTAFETLGKISARAAMATKGDPVLAEHLARAALEQSELDSTSTLLLRLQLDAFATFEFISQEQIEKAAAWARSASISGRQVEAALPEIYEWFDNWSEFGLDRIILLTPSGTAVLDDLLDQPPKPNEQLKQLFK
jgi:uncharacterized protein (DUF1778 family)